MLSNWVLADLCESKFKITYQKYKNLIFLLSDRKREEELGLLAPYRVGPAIQL